MTQYNLTQTEQMRRKEIADHTRALVVNLLQVDAEDETSTVRMKLRSWAGIGIITCRFPFPSCTR